MTCQVAWWPNNSGVLACVKWAPRRFMFATASLALALWVPDMVKLQKADNGP